jgi:DNA-nicking Smr family endonuclease
VVKQLGDAVIGYAGDYDESIALGLTFGARTDTASPRTLDLHRATLAQALQRLDTATRQARSEGLPLLLVIVGKGKHSAPTGPVLPDAVVECLAGPLASRVLAFRSAPPRQGGKGALLVRLRPKSRAEP